MTRTFCSKVIDSCSLWPILEQKGKGLSLQTLSKEMNLNKTMWVNWNNNCFVQFQGPDSNFRFYWFYTALIMTFGEIRRPERSGTSAKILTVTKDDIAFIEELKY